MGHAASIKLTQLRSTGVAWIHCNEYTDSRHQRYRIAHKHKRRFIILLLRKELPIKMRSRPDELRAMNARGI